MKKRWIAVALAAAGSNLIHAVTRRVGSGRPTARVLSPDVATATTILLAERLARSGRTPPLWSMDYVQGLTGTMGPSTKSTKSAVLWSLPIVAATAVVGWPRFKAARRPVTRAAADAVFMTATIVSTQRFADIGSELARGAEAVATQLAEADALRRLVARRRDAQVFVHDILLQVLAFAQKPEMSSDVLLAWIDEESRRIQLAVDGEVERLSPNTRASLDELIGGMRRRGLDVTVNLTDPIILPVAVSQLVVAIVNEALTNALKHSPDQRASVAVEPTDDGWTIRVVNALPSRFVAVEEGVGLANLRRRCGEAHMDFGTYADDRNFTLIVSLRR